MYIPNEYLMVLSISIIDRYSRNTLVHINADSINTYIFPYRLKVNFLKSYMCMDRL